MCGILGLFKTNDLDAFNPNFDFALKKMTHRGPNGLKYQNINLKHGIAQIGHARLSIIDLSDNGNQPMTSSCGNFILVFNGEIYNYKEIRLILESKGVSFFSDSDSEVLLQSWIYWGKSSIKKFQGMFAFVILDIKNQKLFCVRDAFGIKPFYYCLQENYGFCFSSEIPPILDLMPNCGEPNLQVSYSYLSDGFYDNTNETFFKNVYQLLPGNMIEIRLFKKIDFEINKWWNPDINIKYNISFEEASLKFRELFFESIKLHLRSDVPIGAALSGGLDSSSIVCAMKTVNPNLRLNTFSFISNGSKLNEEKWVDVVNEKVKATVNKLNSNELVLNSNFDELLKTQGEPFGSTSIFAQFSLFKFIKESGVTVTLDGQGADEILAGYRGYPAERIKSLLEEWKIIPAMKLFLKCDKGKNFSKTEVFKNLLYSSFPIFIRKWIKFFFRNLYSKSYINKEFIKASRINIYKIEDYNYNPSIKGRRVMFVLREMLSGKGLGALLRHGDRNSMRWGVESRVPFLNTDIVEFVLGLPENYLFSDNFETKYILRSALKDIVPEKILDRKDKVGFEAPEIEWLLSSKHFILEVLEEIKLIPILNYPESKKLIEDFFLNPNSINSRVIWRIINYTRWYKINFLKP